ncbi:hypothetical protein AB0M87_11500 [Streptomyces sp. NPDC051320]|uniref:hypothetical protein n=1 Tax=Streptomyces sp. NPDC051320 TaxID=3154644 RepID=UPI003440BF68
MRGHMDAQTWLGLPHHAEEIEEAAMSASDPEAQSPSPLPLRDLPLRDLPMGDLPMSDLLASCAAADAVSRPPRAPGEEPGAATGTPARRRDAA